MEGLADMLCEQLIPSNYRDALKYKCNAKNIYNVENMVKKELKENELSVLTEKYRETVENELADEVYNKQWVKASNQQLLDILKNVVDKIDEYQKKREAAEKNSPIMQYFGHDKNLGRQVRDLLLEFHHCIQDPEYFTKTYAKFSQK